MSSIDIDVSQNEAIDIKLTSGSGGTTNYNRLRNKPKINGHELIGELTTEDLDIHDGEQGPKGDKGDTGEHRVNLEYKGLKAILVLSVQKALKVQKAILDLIGYLQNKS